MKFSEQWLREWVNPAIGSDELIAQLTMAGLEVDGVEPAAPPFEGVVVGEVLSVEAHPDADKLRVCRVATGDEAPLQIVCGAANVAPGMRVPTALIGARLPGDLKIRKGKLRGFESFGMLCSARELGLAEQADGLMPLAADAEVGLDIRKLLHLDDRCIEIDLTPNRGDCLGLAGIAREVGVLNRAPVSVPEVADVPVTTKRDFPVEVLEPAACPRYLGRVIEGVDARAETPLWMRERLRRSGLRSLGPMVDVTNYVLLELGQPMHAFDLDRLDGGIRVRRAETGERAGLLDGQTVELKAGALVIADHARVQALAGIMGGAASAVGDDTRNLFLECAFFSPLTMAGQARSYGLATDSSYRFERGVDPMLQRRALERASALLLSIVGGKAGPVIEAVAEAHLPKREPILLRSERIRRLLGFEIPAAEVRDILTHLAMQVEAVGADWRVTPPSFRFDVAIEADLIEELVRVHGYHRLPSTRSPARPAIRPRPEGRVSLDRVRAVLVDRGYQEAVTYSFVDPALQAMLDPGAATMALANPISTDLSVMRSRLWPGLVRALQYNLNRQQSHIRLFESGLNYVLQDNELKQILCLGGVAIGAPQPEQWGVVKRLADFYDIKADLEALFTLTGRSDRFEFIPSAHPALHPGQSASINLQGREVGLLGVLHPELEKSLDLPGQTLMFELRLEAILSRELPRFETLSRFPAIRRDLALLVNRDISAARLTACVRAAAAGLLQDLRIFDVYAGKGIETGRKSIALGLILQDSSRTLTDTDVEAVISTVTARLQEELNVTIRS